MEVENIGGTSSETSYIFGRPENKADNAITKKIFQQEIINMKNAEKTSNRSSSSSRESSVGLEMSQINNNTAGRQRQSTGSPKKTASISNSTSSSSINSGRGISPDNQNSNIGSNNSLQNFLNKFSSKDKSPSPNNGDSKTFLSKLGDIKNSFTNSSHHNKVKRYVMK